MPARFFWRLGGQASILLWACLGVIFGPSRVEADNQRVIIEKPQGPVEARLPCNRAASPYCDLRLYQVMVSSFVDGNGAVGAGSAYGPGPHSGDLAGVIQSLDMIQAMGFNAIWLTPIFESHAGEPQLRVSGKKVVNQRLDGTGYYPRDYFRIDPQFGSEADVRTLVDQAHQRGIKIIFDGVFGHHKGGITPSPTGIVPATSNRVSDYFGHPENYPGQVVDFDQPQSLAFYEEVARYWIERFGIDGWRLDQAYQLPNPALARLSQIVEEAASVRPKSGYVVGEIWRKADDIRAAYGTSEAPGLTSAFDFPTRYALVQVLASDEAGTKNRPARTLVEPWALGAHSNYPDHAIPNLMLGNHDLVRFGDLIERAGKGGQEADSYWARHRLAFTFMAAWSGPITFYYGEELGAEVPGFSGRTGQNCGKSQTCDDHIARNMVKLPPVNAKESEVLPKALALRSYLTELLTLRKVSPALSSGARTHLFSDQDVYADLKSLGNEKYVLIMNVSDHARRIRLTREAVDLANLRGSRLLIGDVGVQSSAGSIEIDLPPLSTGIIQLQAVH
ncbi:neopullulanase [Candidatus Phycosocius bacilliformis]|uniref:Neopullulanase n=1 Tax=Candidatus Phycosocius bacilliformis TaxID=1445552 RepID=A0A2P2ED84_9PROT|nr:alpha-amylase family protein [Candidatus Phycosocius bacilliformis]GBF59014.1 neopullulanase [Candidatus Phycosocius bacilliformis]